jgi:flagellar basal-body rod protein FlgF
VSGTLSLIEATMRADAEAVRVIGHNIANAQVTGYRRQIPVTATAQTFAAAADEATLNVQALEASAPTTQIATDLRAGTMQSTGRPLDVALEGSGFFVLQSASGSLLTRRGDLQVSAEGVLVAANGDPVLGEQGIIDIGTSIPVIDADGTIRVNEAVVDRLRVVQVMQEEALQYLGNGIFAADDAASVVTQDQASMRQGFLEASNISPVGEMVQMMEAMRRFESAQRFARGYDQMMEKAISELGKVD